MVGLWQGPVAGGSNCAAVSHHWHDTGSTYVSIYLKLQSLPINNCILGSGIQLQWLTLTDSWGDGELRSRVRRDIRSLQWQLGQSRMPYKRARNLRNCANTITSCTKWECPINKKGTSATILKLTVTILLRMCTLVKWGGGVYVTTKEGVVVY